MNDESPEIGCGRKDRPRTAGASQSRLLLHFFVLSFVLPFVLVDTETAVATESGPKPVAVVGASYGRYETKMLVNRVLLASQGREIVHEACGDEFPAADLDRYGLVIVATAVKTPLAPEGLTKLEAWVKAGGHLLLINGAARSLAGDEARGKPPALGWAGLGRLHSAKSLEGWAVLEPGHPILQGVFDPTAVQEGRHPRWMSMATLLADPKAGMKPVIAAPEGMLVGISSVGKGWVAYVGHELFRLRNAQADPDESWLRILTNLVNAAGPATAADVHAGQMEGMKKSERRLLVWTREWERGERYGPRFDPPLPEERELVTGLEADVAVDEVESLQVNLTPVVPLGTATWRLDCAGFPADRVEFLVQDSPPAIPWPKRPELAQEFPFWMMPSKYVRGGDERSFPMPAPGETRVVWLRVASRGVDPGDYALVLHLEFASGVRLSLPVSLTVHPVRLTDKRTIALGAAGQVYGDVNNAPAALRFARDLESHGVEWSLVNVLRPATLGVVGGQGGGKERLDKFLTARRGRLEPDDFPRIDFSSLDPWMEQSIGHNLTRFRTGGMTENLGLEKLGLDEAGQRAARKWFRSEVARYLRDKGVRIMIASNGDELSPEELRSEFIPWAKEMADSGWGVGSAFSFGEANPRLIGAMSPLVALWTLNRGLLPSFVTGLRAGKYSLRPGAILGTYGAGEGRGSEHRKPLAASRGLGWESWMWGVRDCAVNPYFKSWLYYNDYGDRGQAGGVAGERFVSYLDQDDLSAPLADCPFWEGVRDGMEEGNLAVILEWHLDRMERAGGAAAVKAAAARGRLAKVMGDSPDAIIRWETVPSHGTNTMRRILAGNDDFRAGKRSVLEILDDIRPAARAVTKPSLWWNDIPLVVDGEARATIIAADSDAGPIVASVRDLTSLTLPVTSPGAGLPSAAGTCLVIGNAEQNRVTRGVLERFKSGDAGSDGSGSWYLREFADEAAGRRIVVVAGVDAAATRTAVQLFCRFLRSEGAWLMEGP